MGNVCTNNEEKPPFNFDMNEKIVEYRIRLGKQLFWSGSSPEIFHSKIPEALEKYKSMYSIYNPDYLCLDRFYGPLIIDSTKYKIPTCNCDIYMLIYRYNAEDDCIIGTLSAGRIKDTIIDELLYTVDHQTKTLDKIHEHYSQVLINLDF